jgi:RND family efflux transporter MFP subunit
MNRNLTTLRGVTTVMLLGVAFAVPAQEGQFEMPPARVEVAAVEMRELAPVVELPGTVVSLNNSSIAAEVEGVLTWLANVGDEYAQGEVIARVDPRLLEVAYARATANVSRLEADLRYRKQQLKRAEDLARSEHASATLVDESRANHDQALHQLADARAQLVQAEQDLARAEIRAPFAGHVVQRIASVGEYIAVGEDVIRFVDTERREIALAAPIGLTAYLYPDLEVLVRGSGREARHRIRAVVPVGDPVSRQVEVRLVAENSDWLIGSPVSVVLPAAQPTTMIAVPRDALVQRGRQNFVFRVSADSTAEQIEVAITTAAGMWVGVEDGFSAGDRVVVRGAERLAPGQSVDVATPTASN